MEENKQILLNYSKTIDESGVAKEMLCINSNDIKKVTNDVPKEFVVELEELLRKYFA